MPLNSVNTNVGAMVALQNLNATAPKQINGLATGCVGCNGPQNSRSAGIQRVASGWVQFAIVHTGAFLQRHGLKPTAVARPGITHPQLMGGTQR